MISESLLHHYGDPFQSRWPLQQEKHLFVRGRILGATEHMLGFAEAGTKQELKSIFLILSITSQTDSQLL